MLRHLPLVLIFAFSACAPSEAPPDSPGGPSTTADTTAVPGSPAEATPRPERPVVVFLGTSLTAGLGLARDEDTYVARVAELADSAGLPIHAVNAGVSGETSAGGLRRIDWILREPLDVLVIELGANDGLRGQDTDTLAANLLAIVDRTRALHPDTPVVLAGMEAPPNLGPEYTDRFRRVFSTVAGERDLPLIPFLLEGVAGVPELNQGDGIHPTAEGHRIVAHNVWRVLQPVLRRLQTRPREEGP